MTVRKGASFTHKSSGWLKFTDAAIKYINDHCQHVVFILWGEFAQKKSTMINLAKHHVLKSAHPSPMSAKTGFFGNGHFVATNKWLEKQSLTPIDWNLSATPPLTVTQAQRSAQEEKQHLQPEDEEPEDQSLDDDGDDDDDDKGSML